MTVLSQILNGSGGADVRETLNRLLPQSARSPFQAAAIGDSRVAYNLANATSRTQKTASFLSLTTALTEQRFSVIYNGGLTGQRSDQWQTALSPMPGYTAMNNVDAALSTNALWLFVAGGIVNDLLQNPAVTADQLWNGYASAPGMLAVLNRGYLAGMRLIVIEDTGQGGFTGTALQTLLAFNLRLRDWCASHPGSIFVPAAGLIWNNTATTSPTWKTGYSVDSPALHYAHLAAWALASYIAPRMEPFIPRLDYRKYSALETFANNGKDLISNPLFATATGGTTGTGITASGGVPAGLAITRNGGAASTVTVTADPNGKGNLVTFANTYSATSDLVVAEIDVGSANIFAGDTIYSQVHVDVAAGSVGGLFPYIYNRLNLNGGNVDTIDMSPFSILTVGGPTTAYSLDLKTDDNVIPVGATISGSGKWQVRMSGAGAGTSQTVTLSLPGMTKR